jgi:hypothetical protein
MDLLPGMNECEPSPGDSCRALQIQWKPLGSRKIILLATATINDQHLFANGLFQNIVILYKLFDSMGYTPILFINDKPNEINTVPHILRSMRMITVNDVLANSIAVHMYIEIGMSIDEGMRRKFRMTGTRIVKLYLGNILNIDIETPIFYTDMFFSHHITGELDEIWVSPHYKQHIEYAAVLNKVKPEAKSMKIAPYVWDPCIVTLNGTRSFKWRPRFANEKETFIILEPNISFQKTLLIPLLIAEQNYKENKRDLHVLVGNSERLMMNAFFTTTILPYLELYKDNKITFGGRYTISTIMNDYPYATAICHQWNNQYNYMTLEYLISGFPVVHNAPDWSDVGYFYEGHSITKGATALRNSLMQHESSEEQYRAGVEAIRWRHSPYNPDIQEAWKKLLV